MPRDKTHTSPRRPSRSTPGPAEALPLKPVALILLTALEQRELHGYALHRRVEELAEQSVHLDTGTLYRWLARFHDSGWVERRDADAEKEDERRRYYSLTDLGQQVLDLERARLQRLLSSAAIASEAT